MNNLSLNTTSDLAEVQIGGSQIICGDCFEWLRNIPQNSIHAIVTDPPYGLKEYDTDQLRKRDNRAGGIWRIPPSFDGCIRQPLPRFTALDARERRRLTDFFTQWAMLAAKAMRPGGHVMVAANAFVSQFVFGAIVEGGLEFRGEIIRLVRTLRGGDRPKNAEAEFPCVSSMPKGCYEPWGIFRKPMERGMRVSDCLRYFQTGGLRRYKNNKPFEDVIISERTPRRERDIANHPSLKPQSLMRRLVYAALPLGEGVVVDPFMGAGSTIAAAEAIGVPSIGIERYKDYFEMSQTSIPRLAGLQIPEVDNKVGVNPEPCIF